MNYPRSVAVILCATLACTALAAPAAAAQTVPDPDAAQMPPPAPRSSEAARIRVGDWPALAAAR